MAGKKPQPTPHQKIMRAANRMTGLHLAEDEVFVLSVDDAIRTRAMNDDELDAKEKEREAGS